MAEQIKADNPGFIVTDFPVSAPENIPAGKVSVNVYRDGFSVNDSNSQITHSLKVLVTVSKKGTAAAEDELDAAVDAVMLSLEAMRDVYWQEAQRTIVAEQWEAYEISLQAVRPQIYKSQLLTA
ncbi:hypothetical protein B1A87_005245 [Arthrobacter sp. KBS0703]|uniref:hypothetical protein n=1 Tax=Arthrobacter sp. KBS0703 TaxID=1955698 RepID=UPI001115B4CF|nr:hypothetical protein [Arthrobacter sp. KBS0703]TSE15402.1 hypothetical protein B1A87_005245 [Arthrobacter sp. KBS0703]